MHETKLFIGNIPFDCTTEKFMETMTNIEGYVKADMVKSMYGKSKGFGFITIDNKENTEKLLLSNSIKINDRILKFSKYSIDNNVSKYNNYTTDLNNIDTITKTQTNDIYNTYNINNTTHMSNNRNKKSSKSYNKKNNYIILTNIPNDMKVNDIYDSIINEYKCNKIDIGKYFIKINQKTGERTDVGIFEMYDIDTYYKMLECGELIVNNEKLNVLQYKRIFIKNHDKKPSQLELHNIFFS